MLLKLTSTVPLAYAVESFSNIVLRCIQDAWRLPRLASEFLVSSRGRLASEFLVSSRGMLPFDADSNKSWLTTRTIFKHTPLLNNDYIVLVKMNLSEPRDLHTLAYICIEGQLGGPIRLLCLAVSFISKTQ